MPSLFAERHVTILVALFLITLRQVPGMIWLPRGYRGRAPRASLYRSTMTLVVANRVARGIRLVGDSKITDRDAILRAEPNGALKIVILEPRMCVAFSGGVNRCLDAIRRLRAR